MVNIETVNEKYSHSSPVVDFKSTAGAFACDLLELAELQGKLFRADAKTVIRQTKGSAAAIVVSCCCLLGCLPVMFLGLASALAYCFEMELWLAQIAVGGSFSILSVIVAAVAFRNLTQVSHHFELSAREFSNTLKWTKNVFKSDAP